MALPVITFTVDISNINLGETATLTWNIEGASSGVINGSMGVDPVGTMQVSPTVTTCYIMSASNAEGQVVEVITVTVDIPAPDPVVTTVDVLIPVFSTDWSVVWGGRSDSSQVKCKAGENFPIQMTVKDSAGVDMDLSAYSARYALKKRQSSLTTDYTIEPMDLTIDGGTVEGNVTAVVSSDITPGNYVEEIEIYTANGNYVKKFSRQRVVEPCVIVSTFTGESEPDPDPDGGTGGTGGPLS